MVMNDPHWPVQIRRHFYGVIKLGKPRENDQADNFAIRSNSGSAPSKDPTPPLAVDPLMPPKRRKSPD
jgi:hypothetical protein